MVIVNLLKQFNVKAKYVIFNMPRLIKGDSNPNIKYVYQKELYELWILIQVPYHQNRLKNGEVLGI